jgi:hypothetical protein
MIKDRIGIIAIIIGLVLIGCGAIYDLAAKIHHGSSEDEERYVSPSEPLPSAPSVSPKIAIIIDDMGRSTKAFEKLVNLNVPLTLSFLPDLPFTRDQSVRARAMGFDVMLHLPMEPKGYPRINPGRLAVLCDMKGSEIERTVEKAIEQVPGAIGVDNHMGSKATEDERVMRSVLSVLKRHGLFFVDSLTTNRSVAHKLARRMGVPTVRNDLFIDNSRNPGDVLEYLRLLADVARRRGHAIGIGHPYEATLQALERGIPKLKGQGMRFVRISELVK